MFVGSTSTHFIIVTIAIMDWFLTVPYAGLIQLKFPIYESIDPIFQKISIAHYLFSKKIQEKLHQTRADLLIISQIH